MRLLELTLGTEMGGEVCVNRFNYVTEATAGAGKLSLGLIRALGLVPSGGVLPADLFGDQLRVALNQAVAITDVTCRDVYSNTDFIQSTIGVAGATTGEVLPPFAAFGFNTNRVIYNIARGQKRFIGVSESNQNGGVLVSGAMDNLEAIAETMSATISGDTGAGTVDFIPCVVSKLKYQTNEDVPDADPIYAYKYYPEATQFDHIAQGVTWTAKETVRSQVSRQF